MSIASKCDRCGTLYEPTAGAVHIERLGIASESAPEAYDTWDEIDLCSKCGEAVIAAVEGAIDREHNAELDREEFVTSRHGILRK